MKRWRKTGWVVTILAIGTVISFRATAAANAKKNLLQLESSTPKTSLEFHGAIHLDYFGFDRQEEYLSGAGSHNGDQGEDERSDINYRARGVMTFSEFGLGSGKGGE